MGMRFPTGPGKGKPRDETGVAMATTMASEGMDRNGLDLLVVAYLRVQGTCGETEGEGRKKKRDRETAERAKEAMERGDVEGAERHAQQVHTQAWDEPRLQFRVQGQKMVEMLRKGDEKDVEKAVRFARDVLGPMALDAYPEAYDEFKTRMMAFAVGPNANERNTGCREERDVWSEEEKNELAELVYVTLVQAVEAYEPNLVLLVKYLMLATDSYCKSKGINNDAQWMFELLEFHQNKLPAPLPQQGTMVPLNEADVQSLVQAMQITRQEAVQGLRQVNGDVQLALKNELTRVKINQVELEELVLEYAVFQGLAVPAFPASENEAETSTPPLVETKGEELPLVWYGHGREEEIPFRCLNDRQVHLLRILAMMYQGRFNAAEKKIGELDGAILKNHPSILFNLKQLKYYACLRGGRVVDALEVVRNEMSPLAIEHPELQRELEDVMLAMTHSERLPAAEASREILTSTQKALNDALQVPEPRLLQGLQFLLRCHVDWYALQQCQDKLATHVGLDSLSRAHLQPVTIPQRPTDAPDPTPEYLRARYGRTRIENQWMMDRRTNMSNENSILTLMEFMALSREDAIRLLREHGGSVEAALSSLIP